MTLQLLGAWLTTEADANDQLLIKLFQLNKLQGEEQHEFVKDAWSAI